jgi:predicted nucleic acid-binding protein
MTPTPRALVIDASVLVSYVLPMDVHHAQSVQYVRAVSLAGTQLIAPRLLLVEVGGAVTRRLGSNLRGQQAIERVQQLPNLRLATLSNRLLDHAQQLACELHVRGADAVYVAVADRLGVPLVSWDREHRTRATSRIQVFTPETAPAAH